MEHLDGTLIGPVVHRIDPERVAGFVAATGDDPARWRGEAPPGYGAVVLFTVAGPLLADRTVMDEVRTLLHVDQQFDHMAPLRTGAELEVTGRVERVRGRGESFFVTFVTEAASDGAPVLRSVSTFLMSREPAADPGEDGGEPPVASRGRNDAPSPVGSVVPGVQLEMAKSASRLDVVRYAAVTGDLNPIHWDHDSARAAGVEGVVVHGLLMHAWLAQAAAAFGAGPAPVATIKTRFRSALRPSEQATVSAIVERVEGAESSVKARVVAAATDRATATAAVRRGE